MVRIIISLGLALLGCVFTFFFYLHVINSVGYLNLVYSRSSMVAFAEKAHKVSSTPGKNVFLRLKDGELVPAVRGPTYFRTGSVRLYHTLDDKRFVSFDTGGGHLGTQGYVFAKQSDAEAVHRVVFDEYEGIEVLPVFGDWYSYDSLEE